jgi:alpha-tubulin suppressor-like RCC1 family protein
MDSDKAVADKSTMGTDSSSDKVGDGAIKAGLASHGAASNDGLGLEMLPSDIYLEAAHFLQSSDFARLEASSIDHKKIVAKAVRHQASTLYGDMPARFQQESWPRLAQFMEARARVQASKCGQPTIAGGGTEEEGYSAVITSIGELYTFGTSKNGCLGHGGNGFEYSDDPDMQIIPKQVMALASTRLVSVAAGRTHLVVVAASGDLFTFGAGKYGELGHGDLKMRSVPTIVESLNGTHIVSASAGFSTSAAISSDGSLFTWGSPWGHGSSASIGPLGHERPHGERERELIPRKVERLEPHFAVSSACGMGSTSVLTRDGKVLTMGGVPFFMASGRSDYMKTVIQGIISKPRVVPLSELDARAVHISVSSGLHCYTIDVVLQSGNVYAIPLNPAAAALSREIGTRYGPTLDQMHESIASLQAVLDQGLQGSAVLETATNCIETIISTVEELTQKVERKFYEEHAEALKAAAESGGGGDADWDVLIRLGRQHKFSDENVGRMLCSFSGDGILAVVSESGALFTAGNPMSGFLGLDLNGSEAWEGVQELRQIQGLHRNLIDSKRVVGVAIGSGHTLILTSCGELYTCGGVCGRWALGYEPNDDETQGGGTNIEYGSSQQNIPRKVNELPVLMTTGYASMTD